MVEASIVSSLKRKSLVEHVIEAALGAVLVNVFGDSSAVFPFMYIAIVFTPCLYRSFRTGLRFATAARMSHEDGAPGRHPLARCDARPGAQAVFAASFDRIQRVWQLA